MGDRGNIVLMYPERDEGIFLYTHWAGSDLERTLAMALERGHSRWGDPDYLARVIFCEMIRGDVTGLTGYGIGLAPSDNGHPYLVVDLAPDDHPAEPTIYTIPGDWEWAKTRQAVAWLNRRGEVRRRTASELVARYANAPF